MFSWCVLVVVQNKIEVDHVISEQWLQGGQKKGLSGLLHLALTMGACTQCTDNTVSLAGFKQAPVIRAMFSNSENTFFWDTLEKQIGQGGLSERHPRVWRPSRQRDIFFSFSQVWNLHLWLYWNGIFFLFYFKWNNSGLRLHFCLTTTSKKSKQWKFSSKFHHLRYIYLNNILLLYPYAIKHTFHNRSGFLSPWNLHIACMKF